MMVDESENSKKCTEGKRAANVESRSEVVPPDKCKEVYWSIFLAGTQYYYLSIGPWVGRQIHNTGCFLCLLSVYTHCLSFDYIWKHVLILVLRN